MRRRIVWFVLAWALLAPAGSPALEEAEEAEAEALPAAQVAEDAPPAFWGFTDVRYLNGSEDARGLPVTPPLAADPASFQMAETELDIGGTLDGVDYRVDLQAFGGAGPLDLEIEQAYLRFHFNPGELDLDLTVGQFNAPIGNELLDAPNLNTITHSMLFSALLPTNLTGLMLSAKFGGDLVAKLTVTNPWDEPLDDVSNAKTIGVHLSGQVTPSVAWGFSGMLGREQAGTNEERLAFDAWVQVNLLKDEPGPIENLLVIGEATFGDQTIEGGRRRGDHDWIGLRVEAHADFAGQGLLDRLGATVRFETLSVDMPVPSGGGGPAGHVLTGLLINDASDNGGTIIGLTAAVDYALTPSLKFTVELLSVSGDLVLPGGADDFTQVAAQLVITYPPRR